MDAARVAARLARRPVALVLGARHHVPLQREAVWDDHDGIEIAFHRTGSGVVNFGHGRQHHFTPGSIEIYPSHMPHQQVMQEPGDDCFIRIAPSAEIDDLFTASYYVPRPPDLVVEQDLLELTAGADPAQPQAQAERNYRVTALLLRLIALGGPAQALAAAPPGPRGSRLAQAARAYLHAQARTLTHLDEVAAALGVSSDHLRHEFKRTYGHSLVRELMEVRVGLAEAMLTQSRLPLAVVSRECGFHSEGYLCRVFRLLRGHSPRGREHQKVPSPTDS